MNPVPVHRIQPRDLLYVPAMLPLPSSQATIQFDQFEISSPPPLKQSRAIPTAASFFTRTKTQSWATS
ncbi:uncharacterized protein BJ212DRAFT_1397919, partial [Suillus subaureus]